MNLLILDRDGVINVDSDAYVRTVEQWQPIPGSLEAMTALSKAGYTLAIATNQSGIARGYYTLDTLQAMHHKLHTLLAEQGGKVDCIAYCPHVDADQCDCRKPKSGLLLAIAHQLCADLSRATVVGDALRDWQAAAAVGAAYVQVRTGKGGKTIASGKLPASIPVFDDLASYAASLLGNSRS